MHAPPESLRTLQGRFWRFISAPADIATTHAGLDAQDPDAAPLSTWLASGDEQTCARRLDVYANMYFFRLLEVLAADYPGVEAVLGATRFHNLVTAFLLAHPSRSPTLRDLGAPLADWLRGSDFMGEWPWLAALAAFEWTCGAVVDLADVTPLAAADLATLAPEQWPEFVLRTIPALRLLTVNYAVEALYRQLSDDGAGGADEPAVGVMMPDRGETTLVIWRRAMMVRHRRVDSTEAAALAKIVGEATVAQVCEVLASGDETGADERFVGLLRKWLTEELLSGPEA